jgi:hypothetical protein
LPVFCLGPEQIESLWPKYGHHLERLERETRLVLAASLREDLKVARKQLWGFQDGADITGVGVTEIYESPRGRVCEIYGACGTESERGQIDQIMVEIESWARAIGCTRIRLGGRRGWKRRLHGFAQVGVILEKEI